MRNYSKHIKVHCCLTLLLLFNFTTRNVNIFLLHVIQRMGNIDSAVPFFGKGFNRIYPLIMVIYTILVASNFHDRVLNYFGNWKIFRFQSEAEDLDGFDPSGLIILKRGEQIIRCVLCLHVSIYLAP